MATIRLTGLRARGYHGVLTSERVSGQVFLVDLDLDIDVAQAAATDDVAHTVNYAEVAGVVEGLITGTPVNLIETLAVHIADAVLEKFAPVRAVTVTVNKPQAPIPSDFENVAVTVTQQRNA
ncbi:dihydroneopterin aldolase [Enteractinococcus coprophilus]|uniref:7,8-dihydroneopterin aldolase n=1 Tax=Enteractinococcus coprophilus TaxID=1027633 RepID=A0A543API1_9MICC|nr:dihydroneopterin aldolase [Enteractinococcus coprophilus]TQL74487.1 dihydroneopterin aldolase [Enteractinococcus coprophilus]